MSQTRLTDRKALDAHRARAQSAFTPFLHDIAIDETQDRIAMVNKIFTSPAIVTGFPDLWGSAVPNALVIPDTDTLALQPAAHDLIIHAMGLHWASDPVGQLIQCRNALKPDGLLVAICFGGGTLTELRTALMQAEIEITGGASPRIAPMGEVRTLGALLQRAGFALPVADSVKQSVSYDNPIKLIKDLRGMGETNALFARLRRPPPRCLFQRAFDIYSSQYGADGRIPASFEFVILTGWTPHDSQQQPLRPGSATSRLADALHTAETKLRD